MKRICYGSTHHFVDCMAEGFKNLGWEVEIFDLEKEGFEALERLSGRTYDAVVDFNSILPKAVTDEDIPFLDTIDAPFYNYILDHPLYHHESLCVELKDYHVICLDDNHARYIRKCYRHIKSCHVLPLAGEAAGTKLPAINERPIDLLFTGTYTSPDMALDLLAKTSAGREDEARRILDLQLQNPDRPLEEIVEEAVVNSGVDPGTIDFPLLMHFCFPIDTYMAARSRCRAVAEIARSGVPLTLVGFGWDSFKEIEGLKNVTVLGPAGFSKQFKFMSESKMVLNVMPGFKSGIHDRVFSTMLNGALSLTDETAGLLAEFTPWEEVVTYSAETPEELPDKIRKLLSEPERLAGIAQKGFKKSNKNHTWQELCRKLQDVITK